MRWLPATATTALLAGCASFGLSSSGLDRDAIDRILSSPEIDQMHVGILAVDAATGQTLYARNTNRKFVPASNQKILVTAAALALLGPDYRFQTEIWATGSATGSFLDGDLVVVGSGDPSMSGRYWESGTAALEAIADSLVEAGLRYVAGSTFIDVSAWDSTSVAPTREAEDLRYAYGSTGGAFAIDEGEVEIIVRAGPAVGSPAIVEWSPLGTDDFVRSRVRTSPPDSTTHVVSGYLPESRQLVLDGGVEWGSADTLAFAVRDPVRQAAAALSRALDRAGIEFEGSWEVKWSEGERVGRGCLSGGLAECDSAGVIAAIDSPPLSELIGGILGPSQNWMSEQLLRALGAQLGEGGSWSDGADVVKAYLVDDIGIDPLDLEVRDGSGLSAYNLVTPRALVGVLRHAHLGPHSEAFREAMAEPGEEDSTLEERLPLLEGRLFAKTGSISNVNSLSGYLVRQDGQEVIFSILTNGSGLPSGRVQDAIDDIVEILAR
jgi:D-alanyl-D-alanine carboxypeptidase/D-alanyl-D-alanine-endopeptidase (penicillin-binding protein 4)